MKKVAIILFLLVLLVIAFSFVLRACERKTAPPLTSTAQYIVKNAGTRYYYTDEFMEGKDIYGRYLILKGYYDSVDGKDWIYHARDLKLNYNVYPEMRIEPRLENSTTSP